MKTCFSTEAVDLHHQAPNRNKRESKYYWDELYTLINAAGFSYLEIPYEPKWDFGGRSGIPLSRRSITTKFGTIANYLHHLKDAGIDGISSVHLDPSLFCSGSMESYLGAFRHFAEEALEFAAEAGAEILTLSATPSYFAFGSLQVSEQDFLNETRAVIDAVAERAAALKVKLCIKNEYWGLLRGEKISAFAAQFKNPVWLDVDTANLQIAGIDSVDFIKSNSERIGVVHFTDTAFTDSQEAYRQAMPEFPASAATKVFCDIGNGEVDFKAIYGTLQELGYTGPLVYNCRHSYDVSRSLLRTRYCINTTIESK